MHGGWWQSRRHEGAAIKCGECLFVLTLQVAVLFAAKISVRVSPVVCCPVCKAMCARAWVGLVRFLVAEHYVALLACGLEQMAERSHKCGVDLRQGAVSDCVRVSVFRIVYNSHRVWCESVTREEEPKEGLAPCRQLACIIGAASRSEEENRLAVELHGAVKVE